MSAACQRGHGAAHGEPVAGRHDPDMRLMQFLDQGHVEKDVGVAHVKQCRFVLEMQHHSIGVAVAAGVQLMA